MDKWKALKNKAAFISEHLNNIEKPESGGSGLAGTTDQWGFTNVTLPENTEPRLASVPDQLKAMGLEYDKYRPNQAFDTGAGEYVPFKLVGGRVELC